MTKREISPKFTIEEKVAFYNTLGKEAEREIAERRARRLAAS